MSELRTQLPTELKAKMGYVQARLNRNQGEVGLALMVKASTSDDLEKLAKEVGEVLAHLDKGTALSKVWEASDGRRK